MSSWGRNTYIYLNVFDYKLSSMFCGGFLWTSSVIMNGVGLFCVKMSFFPCLSFLFASLYDGEFTVQCSPFKTGEISAMSKEHLCYMHLFLFVKSINFPLLFVRCLHPVCTYGNHFKSKWKLFFNITYSYFCLHGVGICSNSSALHKGVQMRFDWAFGEIPQDPQGQPLGEAADWCLIFILHSRLTWKFITKFFGNVLNWFCYFINH